MGPWKSLLGHPRSRGRRTVEQVRRGDRAGAEVWSTRRTTAGEHKEGEKEINKCLELT